MDGAAALWIVIPLAVVHALVWKRKHLILFQLAVDVSLLVLPGPVLLKGLHLGPGAPEAAAWGGPITVTGSAEQSDFPLQLAVWWEEIRRLVGSGEYPWISERIGGGTPLAANGQTQLPFPLHLPVWVLGAERGTDVMAVWKLELAALGGFLFLRRLRLLPAAAAVGSLAYAFGLFSLSWSVSPVTWVTATTPWAFWLLVGALRGSPRAGAGLAVVMGVIAGWSVNPESAAFLCLGIAVAGVVLALGRLRRVRRLVIPLLLGSAVAGVGALPTFMTVVDSPKLAHMTAGAQYPSPGVSWALRARVASLLLTPWRYGDPAENTWSQPFPAAPVSLGIGCVALTCLFGGAPRRRLRRWVAALGTVGVLAAVLVWQIPGIGHALARVPVLNATVWVRAGFLVSFVLAMLAGAGADAVLRRGRRTRFTVAAVLVQIAVVVLALTAQNGQARRHSLEVGWLPALAVGLAPTLSAAGGVMLPALVLAETCIVGADVLPGSVESPGNSEPAITRELRRRVTAEGGRILGLGSALPANLGARLGFADLRSHSPVRPLALARLHLALGARGMDLPGPVTTPWGGVAGCWGARWLATPPEGVEGAVATGWQEVYRDRSGRLYRNGRALPAIRVATQVVASPSDPSDGGWEGVDFATTAVTDAKLTLGGGGLLNVTEDRPWLHTANVRASGTVLALLHAPHAPGWHASLDGRMAEIVDANLGAMGVVVPEGDHTVRWEYAPPGLALGVVLTLAGLAGSLLLSLSSLRRRR
jgi:hypothetical protein